MGKEYAIDLEGQVTLYEGIPDLPDEAFLTWWTCLRPEEKQARICYSTGNLITKNGLWILGFSLVGNRNSSEFVNLASIFSVGNGAISSVARGDTAVAGDGFASGSRKVPAGYTKSGLTTTLVMNFQSSDAAGTWTNGGLYSYGGPLGGVGLNYPTTTPGTGFLSTHFLFSPNVVKGASPLAVTYTLTLLTH